MLSNTSRYAIRALIYIAINSTDKKKIGIKKIAEDLDIPSPFLAKILQTLAKHKVISSTKGPNGGFGVSELTLDINLMSIIKIIDGDDLFKQCVITNRNCPDKKGATCALHNHYEAIRKSIKDMFSGHTIGTLAQEFISSGKKFEL